MLPCKIRGTDHTTTSRWKSISIMDQLRLFTCVVLLCALFVCSETKPNRRDTTCEEIRRRSTCADMGYDHTMFPNALGHESADSAEEALNVILSGLASVTGTGDQCYTLIRTFMCHSHVPMCVASSSTMLPPCREMCELLFSECGHIMQTIPQLSSLNCEMAPYSNSDITMPNCAPVSPVVEANVCCPRPFKNVGGACIKILKKARPQKSSVKSCEADGATFAKLAPRDHLIPFLQSELFDTADNMWLGISVEDGARLVWTFDGTEVAPEYLMGGGLSPDDIGSRKTCFILDAEGEIGVADCRNTDAPTLCQVSNECPFGISSTPRVVEVTPPDEGVSNGTSVTSDGEEREEDRDTPFVPLPESGECEAQTMVLCRDLGYTMTRFPNALGMPNQEDAFNELKRWAPLIGIGCSPHMKELLCSLYAPPCMSASSPAQLPCREVCESAKEGCLPQMQKFGHSWPNVINCTKFASYSGSESCYMGSLTVSDSPSGSASGTCELIEDPMCLDFGYSYTMMPNGFGQATQMEASMGMNAFQSLILLGCSPALPSFLCGMFYPVCTIGINVLPCRSLCETARSGCASFVEAIGLEWPPELDCANLREDELCFNGTSMSEMPGESEESMTPPSDSCEEVTVPLCQDMPYYSTSFPNMFGQVSQEDAALEVHLYEPLVQMQCSPHIKEFLCAAYVPMCGPTMRTPCRELCQSARAGCEDLMVNFGFEWPGQLACESFPSSQEGMDCYIGSLQDDSAQTSETCQPLRVPSCSHMPYNFTEMQNTTQKQIETLMQNYLPLIQLGCSSALTNFFCSIHAPPCSVNGMPSFPCREMCEAAIDGCPILQQAPADQSVDCNLFPPRSSGMCVYVETEMDQPSDSAEASETCQPLRVPSCSHMPYNFTDMQNTTQEQIETLMQNYLPLIQLGCSSALTNFFCSIHAPPCSVNGIPSFPCREMCEAAIDGCPVLQQAPAAQSVDCHLFPPRSSGMCVYVETEMNQPSGSQTTVPPALSKFRDDYQCGGNWLAPNGEVAECDPDGIYPCCSPANWCGITVDHCDCGGCIDYRRVIENIRLVDGSTSNVGRVEVMVNGEWGTVCDDFWDISDAQVVCRQLGFTGAITERGYGYFGEGSGRTWLDNVECIGTEGTLQDCPKNNIGDENCEHYEDAGVECTPIDTESRTTTTGSQTTAPPVLSKFRDDYQCGGNWLAPNGEVAECDPDGIYPCCSPANWCGITVDHCDCDGCIDYRRGAEIEDIRLVNGESSASGRVEVLVNGQWGTVCHDKWSIEDATVVCRWLGFPGVRHETTWASFGEGTGPIWLDNVRCAGDENTLNECRKYEIGDHNCDHREDAGVVCEPISIAGSEEIKAIRLVNGDFYWNGRVEVLVGRVWGTICDDLWDIYDAQVVCGMLGYGVAEEANINAYFGSGDGPIWLDNVECFGNETTLDECKKNDIGENDCGRYEHAGVKCNPFTAYRDDRKCGGEWLAPSGEVAKCDPVGLWPCCSDKDLCENTQDFCDCEDCVDYRIVENVHIEDVRLIDGSTENEGRVEVLIHGQWGTICHNNWDHLDANIVCRQLGYTAAKNIYYNAYYGRGTGRIWLNNVNCGRSGESLNDCPHDGLVSHDGCSHAQDAGIECYPLELTPDTEIEDIRLRGGYSRSTGRVEVYVNGEWGTVCSDRWDIEDAHVACRWLGWDGADYAKTMAFFGEGSGPIWVDNIRCRGDEDTLNECKKRPLGVHNCRHEKDAGVECSMDAPTPFGPRPGADYRDDYRCGGGYHAPNGGLAYCNRDGIYPCCATHTNWCGNDLDHCGCDTCIDYRDDSVHDIRLSGGGDPNVGQVQVFIFGRWGSVCSDYWDINDAQVACRQLGYPGAVEIKRGDYYGEGWDPVLMDDVQCTGEEETLSDCPRNPPGRHDCDYRYESASVICALPQVATDPAIVQSSTPNPTATSYRSDFRCGGTFLAPDGEVAKCDPNSTNYCCSNNGWCGSDVDYCGCRDCVDFRAIDESANSYREDFRCGEGFLARNGKMALCDANGGNPCCSGAHWCGNSPAYCECESCIDFRLGAPSFRNDLRCGGDNLAANGEVAICDGKSSNYCCSENGMCGSGPEFCDCPDCIQYLPTD